MKLSFKACFWLYLIVSSLLSCTAKSEGMRVYFNSPSFKDITVRMLTQNQSCAAPGGSFSPYVNTLGSVDNESEKFYGFLLEKGYLTFKENSVPFYRSNVRNAPFGYMFCALPNYSSDLEKHFLREDNETRCQIAERELQRITYKKSYTQENWSIIAFTFQYAIKPMLSGLPVSNKVFEGKVKLGKNPDDGKWVVMEQELGDRGDLEILPLLSSGKLRDYITKRYNELDSIADIRRGEDLKKAKEFTYIVGPEATFLGIVTSDDAIRVDPLQGNFSRTELIFNYAHGHRPIGDLIGKRFIALGYGGEIVSWNKNGWAYIDMQRFHDSEGLRQVSRYELAVNLAGSPGAKAKVTVYCIENSHAVNFEYWYGGTPFPSCSERLKSLDISEFPINK